MLEENTNLDSVRERQLAERGESTRRWRLFVVTVFVLLAVGLGGLTRYTYPILERHASSLARLPGVETTIGTVQQDLKNADSRLTDWSGRQEELRQRVEKFSRETRMRIDAASKRANDAAAATARRIESDVEGQMDGLRTRMTNIESSGERNQMRIASLQQELNEVRGEVTRQSNELAATRRQVDGGGASTERQISSLRNDQQNDRRDVDAISSRLAVERVDFEVSKGHSQQLAPSISIGLTGTDILSRRASGWMWVMPDRRTIWLRSQSAQEPVVFYGLADGKKRELVITHVTKSSIAGYLILPRGADATAASDVAANDQSTVSARVR
jgi:hypothetical protein